MPLYCMLWHGLLCENALHMLRHFQSTNVMNSLAQKIGLNNCIRINFVVVIFFFFCYNERLDL